MNRLFKQAAASSRDAFNPPKKDVSTRNIKVEELEMSLEASHEVNMHLNGEVEKLTLKVDILEEEKAAYEKHVRELALLLAKERLKGQSENTAQIDQLAESLAIPGNHLDNGHGNGQAADMLDESEWEGDARWVHLREMAEAGGWLADPSEICLGRELGTGTFGTTYRATWRGGDAAVKCVRVGSEDEAESFIREVATLATIRHPNVMPFYGACLLPPQHCWLICEYLPGGTLSQWLYGGKHYDKRYTPKRSMEERLKMSLGVASGMQALEEADPPILHRDLKPSNIFIDSGGHPRVADMGLARRCSPEEAIHLTGETGTYIYMSPEMIKHEMYDSKTDVFSWGVMFTEILSQRPPYEGLFLTPIQVALAVGDGKLRPAVPTGLPDALLNLAEACLADDPFSRPSFSDIAGTLREVLAHTAPQQPQGTIFARTFGLFKQPGGLGGPSPQQALQAAPRTNSQVSHRSAAQDEWP